MSLISNTKKAQKRPGVILLVVLAMLTLLAIIGITFVMYATSLEQCSEAALDEQKADFRPRFDQDAALSMFLGQFVYDVEDNTTGQYSVLRGHSLARDLYGYQAANNGQVTFPLDRPFGGRGYADPTQPNFLGQATVSGQPNVSYTAPDKYHWYLAKLSYDYDYDQVQGKNVSGKILKVQEPSFWRSGISDNPATPASTFRYKPASASGSMANGFPAYPTQNQRYDVQNLPGGTEPDSIWIDINAPVQTMPNGRKYKMMVAPLIVDLDGRLNVAMAGNKMTSFNNNFFHGSHEGYGPWEGNLDQLVPLLKGHGDTTLNSQNINAIQSQILAIKYGASANAYGYQLTGSGSGGSGGGGGTIPTTYSPRAHNQMDYNGGLDPDPQGLTSAVPAFLPGSTVAAAPSTFYQAFPYFFPGMYGNSASKETTNNGQTTGIYIHPTSYNPIFPNGGRKLATDPFATNIAFGIRDMGPLMLWRSDKDNFTKDTSNNTYPVKQAFGTLLNGYGNSASRSALFDHLTLVSADFDKPGVYPYVDNKTTNGLQWAVTNSTTAPYWPRRTSNNFTQPPVAEQNAIGLATRDLTRFARINLGQFGPDYPAIDPATGQYLAGSDAQTIAASQGRTLLANKVLDGLCAATGTPDMRSTNDSTNAQYKAWVWLAQLAANIVDFVDPDDVMTVMDLSPSGAPGTGRKVYGTELPKVVINEIYAQADNSASDYAKTSGTAMDDYTVSLFLELLNPTADPGNPALTNVNMPNTAYIQVKGASSTHTIYEIEVAQTVPIALKDPFATNGMGQVDLSGIVGYTSNPLSAVGSSANPWVDSTGSVGSIAISPAGANYTTTDPRAGSQGFLWIGPTVSSNIQDTTMQTAWTYSMTNTMTPLEQPTLKYTWTKSQGAPTEATVLLRRLVNPGLPADNNTNPYVLVDYVTVKPGMVQDARKRDSTGANSNTVAVASRQSYGRRQPYAGKDIVNVTTPDLGAYKESTKTNSNAPMGTFGSLNFNTQPATLANEITAPTETAETPDWLAHFDRVPVSPLPLTMVSTYRPHELTQKFLDQVPSAVNSGTNVWLPHQHSTAWMDEMTGLQRFFELVQTHGEKALTSYGYLDPVTNNPLDVPLFPMGGRYQGRVNLNTVPIYKDSQGKYWSPVLEALFDVNNSNRFTQDQIRNLINSIGANRASGNGNYFYGANPLSRAGSILQSQPTAMVASDDPWQSYQPNSGNYRLNGNLLFDPFALDATAQPNGAPLRTSTRTTHPMVRMEALEKIYNQTTVRSNVFAIWVTVGFFEVIDSTTLPVKLGGEIGAANGRNQRYKMFAIVDRTRIKSFELNSTAQVVSSSGANGDYAWQNVPFTANSNIVDSRTGKTYNLLTLAQQQPLVLTFDPDKENEETVEVWFTSNQLQAQFRKNHVAGCKIISRGNPGPMKNYDHRNDSDVVLYATILE